MAGMSIKPDLLPRLLARSHTEPIMPLNTDVITMLFDVAWRDHFVGVDVEGGIWNSETIS
jgi:hypothetical protein